jgi:ADP-heptose:LPS heptosyltransferase
LPARVATVAGALLRRAVATPRPPASPPKRILLAHHLLLGDTLLLAPLMAKLATRYPQAERVVLARPAVAPLFAGRPWGWRAEPFDVRDATLPTRLRASVGFDLAYALGDNRYAWLARAAGARWIVGFAADRPAWKNWMVDEPVDHAATPMAWADMATTLSEGDPPPAYWRGDWPMPPATDFSRPAGDYAVLHVGASSPLKTWPAERWAALAAALAARGLQIIWSAGRGEAALVAAADPGQRWPRHCGDLDLPQLWQLIDGARLLVCPDTGVAHLGRVVGTPTVTLFGPGSVQIHGAGAFWRESPFVAVTVEPFPCRDQHILFRRRIAWVRRCQRGTDTCVAPRCMAAIALDAVLDAATCLLDAGVLR